MGSEAGAECETSTPTPKLSLYSFPIKSKEAPLGIATPPIHTSVSIPFQWEEAPGKPRPCTTTNTAARCLELPPRLLLGGEPNKVANMPSPTTVFDGPANSGRFVSYTLSFRKDGSFRWVNNNELGSSRWGSFRKAGAGGGSDFSTTPVVDHDAEVKITRVRGKGSLFSLSQARQAFMKALSKWSHGQEKMKKKGS